MPLGKTLAKWAFGFDYGETKSYGTVSTAAIEAAPGPVVAKAIARSSQFSDDSINLLMSVFGRDDAMKLGTINRARDLICGAIATIPLVNYTWDVAPDGTILGETILPPLSWTLQPDPFNTRGWVLASTVDDLVFYSEAFWHVTSRYVTGYPATFEWLPRKWCGITRDITTDTLTGLQFNGTDVFLDDVVEFKSPLAGVLDYSADIIATALFLEGAAQRFAKTEVPSGWLKQTGGEPLGPADLKLQAEGWNAARKVNATAALNSLFDWNEANYDPERLQLIQARLHSSTEQAKLMNVPPTLVAAPANNSMTYSNQEQARQDLWDFALAPLCSCIEQTLSFRALPNRRFVRFDPRSFLRNPFTDTGGTGTGVVKQEETLNEQDQPQEVANGTD